MLESGAGPNKGWAAQPKMKAETIIANIN